MTAPLLQSNLSEWPLLFRGKVRDVYDLGDLLMIVTSDRISAFDYVLETPIPEKGRVLTQMSRFWMKRFAHFLPNHLLEVPLEELVTKPEELTLLKDRTEIVKKAEALPVEMIVRGYLVGSGYQEYTKTGAVSGINLPPGLEVAAKLPEPIFTPSTKAPQGEHDENISFSVMAETIGKDLAEQARDICLKIYREAADYALTRGIIIADTKIELGVHQGKLILIDEVLTPDSSRFWPLDAYKVGSNPPSFDKQFVRDHLSSCGWDKNSTPPALPADIVAKTSEKYQEALQLLVE